MSFIIEFQVIFCAIVLILGFVGNLLVIITFGSKGTRLKRYEVLMINLAVADLLGTFCIPLLTILTLKSVDISSLGDFGCQFIYWLATTSLTVSAFSLVAISVHRFMTVIWPLQKQGRPWEFGVMALLSWIMASFVGIIYFFRVSYYHEHNICRVAYKDDSEDIAHAVSLFLIQMVFPIIIMSTMYGIILYRLKLPTTRELSVHSNAIRQKRYRKSTKLFMTVIIVFYVLTLPYNIFYMWYTVNWKTIRPEHTKTILHMYHILVLIFLSNSCINPLIYARLHEPFRRNTLRILCPRLVKRFPKPFSWKSRLRRSTSATTTTSSPGAPSPCHPPEPITRTSDQTRSCDSTKSVISHDNKGYCLSSKSVQVSYLKDDQTVKFHEAKTLNGTEGP